MACGTSISLFNWELAKADSKKEKQRYNEAWKVLRRLHSPKFDPEARLAHAEFIQIKAQIEAERVRNFWYKSLNEC